MNVSRQLRSECGYFVCHDLEEEMRAACGFGEASVRWPTMERIKTVRLIVQGWTKVLSEACKKWTDTEKKAHEQAEAWAKRVSEAARKRIEKLGLLEKLSELLSQQANISFDEGASVEPPPHP